ncbi:probable cyclin-dependent serine/threonine-protein kinase DDB_G0292550 isoform X1 [Microplitis demolitor]|uniref:probable cyclin-dependent serine/threonine-protein kinase DDB_G0292550 isoform X1 n=1 Tax=Microplitis demolitor TaxID=69319 RepID=UPI00235B66A3|nr:probable cyclin-dependent serine/threonine-protein kinase DDB_G0292550 isoform X1 [Microplitis demolitor]
MSELRDCSQDGDYNKNNNIYSDLINVDNMNFDCCETCFLDISDPKGLANLKLWLRDSPSLDDQQSTESKKLIDTRTWTRPKKRFSRLSIDAIPEVAASLENSPMKPAAGHLMTSTPHVAQLAQSRLNFDLNERINVIPSVLRSSSSSSSPSAPPYCGPNFGQSSTGQKSLEAFLDISQQNGVDPFLNMETPEFNESLLMNNKQPPSLTDSLLMIEDSDQLISSTQSLGPGIGAGDAGTGTQMDDSQILTTSMMQTSLFGDITDPNNPFAKDLSDGSCIENPNFNGSLNKTVTINQSLSPLRSGGKRIDATFNADELYAALNSESFVINRTFDKNELNHLSYVICADNDGVGQDLDLGDKRSEFNSDGDMKNDFGEGKIRSENSDLGLSRDSAQNHKFENSDQDFQGNSDQNLTYGNSAQDLKYKNSDQDLKYGTLDQDLNYRNSDQDLEHENPDQNLRCKNSDQYLEHENSDQDLKYRKSNQDLKYRRFDKDLTSVNSDRDLKNLRYRNPDQNLKYKSSDQGLRYKNTDKDLEHENSDQDLKYRKLEQDLTYVNSDRDLKNLRYRNPDQDLKYKSSNQGLRYKNSDKDLEHENSDQDLKYRKLEQDLTYVNSDRDLDDLKYENSESDLHSDLSDKNNINSNNEDLLNTTITKMNTTINLNSPFSDHEQLQLPGSLSEFKEPLNIDNKNKCLNSTFLSDSNKILNETYDHSSDLNYANDHVIKNRYQTYRKTIPSKLLQRKTYGFNNQDTRSLENLSDKLINKKSSGIGSGGVGASRIGLGARSGIGSGKNLSRLPQSLQKSNPNLNTGTFKLPGDKNKMRSGLYSLRKPGSSESASGDDEGFGSKKYCKLKYAAQGSTESIESTQSIASAPDLDDCLSVDSDDKDFKERKIMENTWIADPSELPSPILKEGDTPLSRANSCEGNDDSSIKTSSPIISPSSLRTVNYSSANNDKPMKSSLPQKQTIVDRATKNPEKQEIRSGIRPPTNRSSGIPRPASRIPAPGFARSNFSKKNIT